MSGPKNQRRSYLINPRFQWSMIGYALFLGVIVGSIFYASNLYLFLRFVREGQAMGLEAQHPFFDFLAEQRRIQDRVFLITAVLSSIAIVAGGVFISHRIAGPLHRLKTALEEMRSQNRLDGVAFRKADYFSDLSQSINEFLEWVRSRQNPRP